MNGAAAALTNLARAAVGLGVGATVVSQAIYDGAERARDDADARRRAIGPREGHGGWGAREGCGRARARACGARTRRRMWNDRSDGFSR